jgi:hypothetical protein
MTPPWKLRSPFSALFDTGRLIFWVLLLMVPWMMLMGCSTPSITTGYLDEVAVERARYMCLAARVPLDHLGDCIARDVASRRETQWFGAWSPI